MKSVFVYAEVSEDLPATSQLLRVFSTLDKARAYMQERMLKYFGFTLEEYEQRGGDVTIFDDCVFANMDGNEVYCFYIEAHAIDEEETEGE